MIARVDCSGSSAGPPDRRGPADGAASGGNGVACAGWRGQAPYARGVAGEVAEARPRVEVVLLPPHPLEAGLEVPLDQLAPGVALDPAPAPVELEEDVGVEVGEDLVEVDVALVDPPVRGRRDRG